MKFKATTGLNQLFLLFILGALLSACGSNPTTQMGPQEIASHLGYSALSPVQQIPSDARYKLERVNSRAAVFDYGRAGEFLLTFEQLCLGLRDGGTLKSTSTDHVFESGASLVIDGSEYCLISEVYRLQGKEE